MLQKEGLRCSVLNHICVSIFPQAIHSIRIIMKFKLGYNCTFIRVPEIVDSFGNQRSK